MLNRIGLSSRISVIKSRAERLSIQAMEVMNLNSSRAQAECSEILECQVLIFDPLFAAIATTIAIKLLSALLMDYSTVLELFLKNCVIFVSVFFLFVHIKPPKVTTMFALGCTTQEHKTTHAILSRHLPKRLCISQ